MNLKLGHLGSKTRSQGQIKEIPCGHSRDNISCLINLRVDQNVCLDEISDELEFGSPGGVKKLVTRSNERNTM